MMVKIAFTFQIQVPSDRAIDRFDEGRSAADPERPASSALDDGNNMIGLARARLKSNNRSGARRDVEATGAGVFEDHSRVARGVARCRT
jgi:hypothetical protein